MAIVLSQEQAEEHLRDIRRRKGADDPVGQESDNTRDLDRALNLLSDQLYEKETHFLLELIQNADDNTYENGAPFLSFASNLFINGHWALQIVCNETGFRRENVEALCSIGDSTKIVSGSMRGYIGEKGIGFKSVFKVASVVRIHSKAYSFMLDRRARLGMITPLIDNSEWQRQRYGQADTSMLLELNGESELNRINAELQKLQPQILLFLNKISSLQIQTPDRHFRFNLWRLVQDQACDGKETAILRSTQLPDDLMADTKYIIVRHEETLTQTDERRPNVRETEVVLGFPVTSFLRPLLQSQYTYAFLPINDYGFNYLIQGDFLLIANRESVDSSRWNDNILEVVLRAFVSKAVPRFNETRSTQAFGIRVYGLRYTWPLYLQDRGSTNTFWCKLKDWIFSELAQQEVLESRESGKFCRPANLTYIPLNYRLNGEPFIEDEVTAQRHLSFGYDLQIAGVLRILRRMGVLEMSIYTLLDELRNIISSQATTYLESRSVQWHSKMAELFLRHRDQLVASHFDNIPFIPLRDGRWVTVSHGHIFLEEHASNSTIPAGLNIHLVRAEACQDPHRNAFFRFLGIRNCDRIEVCRMIIERHSRRPAQPLDVTVNDALYLFQTPRAPQLISIRRLWLVQAPTGVAPTLVYSYGYNLYVEEANTSSIISKYADNPASNMLLLHPMYITKARELGRESEFVRWLCFNLDLSTKPRLVDTHGRLTPEFNFLKANASKDFLLLLRDSWNTYAYKLESRSSALNHSLTEMNVLCIDRQWQPLGTTVLPREQLKVASPHLPFVDVPDPEDLRWNKLAHLGVLILKSENLYLRELKALAVLPVHPTTTKSAVEAVYAGIQSSIRQSNIHSQLRTDFISLALIFINNRWVYLSQCVWSGDRLDTVYNLSSKYPQYRQLFQDYLRVGNVNASHVIKELQQAESYAPTERLKELLLLLNKHLMTGTPRDLMVKLSRKRVFPVRNLHGNLEHRSYNEQNWYLADRQSLWDSFNGRLPLLDFDVKTVRELQPLIEAFQMMPWRLSAADEPRLERSGTSIYNEEKTQDLRQRVVHLLQLLPRSTAENRTRLLQVLTTLEVFDVPEIKLHHEVRGVEGAKETGNIIFDDSDDNKLIVYISLNNMIQAVVENQLSKEFIRYCSIPIGQHTMVGPILNFPHESLRHFLDENGLDGSLEVSDNITSSLQINAGANEGLDRNPLANIVHEVAAAPGMPNSDPQAAFQELGTEVSRQPSLLRERIPTLDESISAVRRAAALPTTAPTLITAPSRERASLANSVLGIAGALSNNEQTPNQTRIHPTGQLFAPATNARAEPPSSPLDMRDLQATFSEVFSVETTLQASQRTSARAVTPSIFGVSSRTARLNANSDANPAHSTLSLHYQHIGLLGEIFINDWLSRELSDDWNPILQWTSRNRNVMYPEALFRASERDYADFTYRDVHGGLSRLLLRYGFIQDVRHWLTNPPTYHLEVKSTTATCNEPFFMSNNQVEKARDFSFSFEENMVPENVYVVIRVYNLERQTAPGFAICVDPWGMYLRRQLNIVARGDYAVTLQV